MRYFIVILLLAGCSSNSVTVTPHQIALCNELGVMSKTKASVGLGGNCQIRSDLWGVTEYFHDWEQIEGAIQLLDFQQALKIKPLQKACRNKCVSRIPKNLCDIETRDRSWECLKYCDSAEGLDEYLQTGKTSGRQNETRRCY